MLFLFVYFVRDFSPLLLFLACYSTFTISDATFLLCLKILRTFIFLLHFKPLPRFVVCILLALFCYCALSLYCLAGLSLCHVAESCLSLCSQLVCRDVSLCSQLVCRCAMSLCSQLVCRAVSLCSQLVCRCDVSLCSQLVCRCAVSLNLVCRCAVSLDCNPAL